MITMVRRAMRMDGSKGRVRRAFTGRGSEEDRREAGKARIGRDD